MSAPKLNPASLRESMKQVPGWNRRGATLRRTFEFADFPAAMKFVNAIARIAENLQHHPDIDIRWNRVTLVLTTHDSGGLTALDFTLAARASQRAQKDS